MSKKRKLMRARLMRIADLPPIEQLIVRHFFGPDAVCVITQVSDRGTTKQPRRRRPKLSHAKVGD